MQSLFSIEDKRHKFTTRESIAARKKLYRFERVTGRRKLGEKKLFLDMPKPEDRPMPDVKMPTFYSVGTGILNLPASSYIDDDYMEWCIFRAYASKFRLPRIKAKQPKPKIIRPKFDRKKYYQRPDIKAKMKAYLREYMRAYYHSHVKVKRTRQTP